MIPIPRLLGIALLVGIGFAFALPAAAQSFLNPGGLGVLSEPLDGRARAVGGAGVGLEGWHLLSTDPAAAAGLVLPSVTAAFQPSASEMENGLEAGGTRFPILGASYPFGRHVLSLQFGSFLDQEWRSEEESSLNLSERTVDVVDIFESEGGLGQIRLGWATRIRPSLAVGVNVGSFVGSMERRFTRELNPDQVGVGVDPFEEAGRWRASGAVAAAGIRWMPSELVTLGGTVEWTGDLTMDPVAPTPGGERSYSMPLTLRAGGTFSLMPGASLVLGVSRSDWSPVDEELGGGVARDVAWSYGGGVEWSRGTVLGRPFPMRLGYRSQELPFHFRGEPSSESAFSGGIGLNLADVEAIPLARVDISLGRGERTAGPVSETFWRTTVSVRLAGG
jgi:hypothetical protein